MSGGGDLFAALSFVVPGAALGWAYFAALRASVRGFAAGHSAVRLLALAALRLSLACAAFALIARFAGPVPVIAALGGFLLARLAAQRRRGTTP